ncbi:hypothetical protein [Streptosporangium canum]|uniref:hypothetical protein n=1 Tax=Streptosporangium canum TaxID=324952 RepID=UPI0015A71FE2|nr:hypothetical protein [Streptosporangium canum]
MNWPHSDSPPPPGWWGSRGQSHRHHPPTFALRQARSARRDGDEEELADGLTGYR